MVDARPNVLHNSGKVMIGQTLLQAKLPDHRRHFGVVAVMHAGEQVMLDLVVEAAIEKAQPLATHVGRRDHLVMEERAFRRRVVQLLDADEVVADMEEEAEVGAEDDEHGRHRQPRPK